MVFDRMMTGLKPRVRVNRQHDPDQIYADLEISINLLRRLPEFRSPRVLEIFDQCLVYAKDILTWAPQYDLKFNGITYTSNGYWTIIIMANKLTEWILSHPQYAKEAVDILELFTIGYPMLKTTHEMSKQTTHHRELHSDSTPLLIDLMHLYLNSTNVIEALCGPGCGPHLCTSERLTRDAYQTAIGVYIANNWFEALNCMVSKRFRGKLIARSARKFDVRLTKRVLSISDFEPVRSWLPMISTLFQPVESRNVYVKYQSKYRVGFDDLGHVELVEDDQPVDRFAPIRCKYLRANGDVNCNQQRAVLFAIHGGGFAAQSPETHEFYTRHWAPQLRGIPIVSIDYSKAPKHKFPVALNEILSVYMWMFDRRHRQEVIDQIGYVPDKVVLFGDSAGGNHAMSLLLVLNDIRRLFKDHHFLMPTSIVTCYAAFNLVPKFAPSYFMTAVDPFLSPMVLFNLIDAYVPTANLTSKDSSCPENFEWSSSTNYKDLSMMDMIRVSLKWLNPITNSSNHGSAWFDCDKDRLMNRISKFNDLFEHPYISSIKYQRFEELSSTELYLLTPYFDPLHDDSISMAKMWKGPLKLDVFDSLSHGFLHFVQFSPEAREGADLVLDRIKEAFRLNC